jgi:hypothetical protein
MSNITKIIEVLKDKQTFRFNTLEDAITEFEDNIKEQFGDDKPDWYPKALKAIISNYKKGKILTSRDILLTTRKSRMK